MKKLILLTIIAVFSVFLFTSQAKAQFEQCDAAQVGQCINGGVCTKVNTSSSNGVPITYYRLEGTCGGGNLGKVEPPEAIRRLNLLAGMTSGANDYSGIGIIYFLNRLITLINVIAGIVVMFNVIAAGWTLLTSWGKSDSFSQMKDRLTYSFIGLAVVAFSYTIAGVLGFIFFQDATAIVSPQLCNPESTATICQ